MHLLLLAEGYSEGLKKFEKTFDGKFYKNNNCKIRVREVKLYTIGLNEIGYKDFLADLKPFMRIDPEVKNIENYGESTFGLWDKLKKYIKFIRKFFKGIKPIEEDLEKIKASNFRDELRKKGTHLLCYFIPIGKIEDAKIKDKERV